MNQDKPRHRIPWLAVIFGAIALYTFFQIANQGRYGGGVYDVGVSSSNVIPPSAAIAPTSMREAGGPTNVAYPADMKAAQGTASMAPTPAMYPNPYPYSGGNPAVTDTREFNKIYYNATMRTRDVPGLTRLIETTVRGNGGRVDNTSSSEKYGSVTFALPQTKFEEFRNEIESFIDWRFLTVNINSQNMLPQKQAIEKQQDWSNMNLDQLNAARKSENATFAQKKSDIQDQIDANDRENAMLQKQLPTTDQNAQQRIVSRGMELVTEQSNLRNQLDALEKSHLNTINSIDAQIRYVNGDLTALKEQDKNLMDDVATVSGTISINWISLWEIAQAYLPGYWIPGIFAALALATYWWHRRKNSATV